MAHMQLTRAKLVALVCLLAAVATQVQVSLAKHAHHGQHGHHSHNHGQGNENKDGKHDRKEDDTWLDAFDEEICGEATLRSWQRKQSAFGCAKASNSYEPSKDIWAEHGFGKRANEGEFPFYVRINATAGKSTQHCSGILVSKDIVITTADSCLRPDSGTISYVGLELGTIMADDDGREERIATRWCTSSNKDVFAEDLAVLLVYSPITYKPGKIGPACMRRLNGGTATHSNETTCALATSCTQVKPYTMLPGPGLPAPGKELRSVAVKRAAACKEGHKMLPYENCYIGKDTGKICEGDRGGPLVCYDKCSKKNKDKVQAFVVGALSQYDNHNSYSEAPSTVINFEKSYDRIMELLRAVRNYKYVSNDRIKCGQNHIDY